MQTIIALLFCLLLGVMVKAQGWFAFLWVPFGFIISRFDTAQITLPTVLGLPRAIHLVSSGEMRAAVYRRLLFPSLVWIVHLSAILLLVRFFSPSAAAWFETNGALNGGVWLGVVSILLSVLSNSSRADFEADFAQSYRKFYVHRDTRRWRPSRKRSSTIPS